MYAEPLARTFAAQHITDLVPRIKFLDLQVHALMDVKAIESHRTTSHSMTASSYTTNSKDAST
jgi:hypothetical protein